MPAGQSAATFPFQIIAGPADVYWASVGTAFPLVNVASTTVSPPAGWTALGHTQGGVTAKHGQTVEQITADQNTGPIKAVRSSESLDVTFSMIDLTIEAYAIVLNQNPVTVVTGPPADHDVPLHRGRSIARQALLIRSDSPYGNWFMQYEIPVCVMSDSPQMDFAENKVGALQTTWTVLEDLTQATEATRFGILRAQSA